MSFDALTLAAVVDEVRPVLEGARIQKVVFPDAHSVALEAYGAGRGAHVLMLDAHPDRSSVYLLPRLPARGVEVETPFHLLARKHLRSARIREVAQPHLERILVLHLDRRDDAGRPYHLRAIVEVMGQRSNFILVADDGAILDALRRAPPARNPRRPILPSLRYTPPAPQSRLDPSLLTATALAERAAGAAAGAYLAKVIVESVSGLSPLAAREIAFRATGSAQSLAAEAPWEKVIQVTGELTLPLQTRRWQPTIARRDGSVVAYAPYAPLHLAAEDARIEPARSMSDAIALAQREAPAPRERDPLAAERRALFRTLASARETVARRRHGLESQAEIVGNRDELRRDGETLLTYQWQLEPGATGLQADGREIQLDPDRSPVEQAQALFARYRRLQEGAKRLAQMVEEAQHQEEHLATLAALVQVADTPDAVRALRREVAEATGQRGDRGARPRKGAPAPARGDARVVRLDHGWEALVGTSAEGNASVTFSRAGPSDWWLHARGAPGAHVVLLGKGAASDPPTAVLERAAALAAWYSARREDASVDVDIVRRKGVRKVPHGPPGLVRYTGERTLRVRPLPPA